MQSPSPAVHNAAGRLRRARPLLGTLVEIDVTASCSARQLHAAIDSAFAIVERVHALMSYHAPDSDVSDLNRHAHHGPRKVDAHTFRVLEGALRLSRLSQGAFDPCVGGHLEAWGSLPQHGAGLPVGAGASGTWRDIELRDDHCVSFRRPLRLDLGGIAKGYAVDQAVRILQQCEIDQILVNAGGDLRILGPSAQPVHLRHPLSPAYFAHTVLLRNAALASSAAYYSRRSAGRREVSALVDPRSGEPYLGHRSVSVRAPDCMTADALTKLVLFADRTVASHGLSACGAEAFVLDPAA